MQPTLQPPSWTFSCKYHFIAAILQSHIRRSEKQTFFRALIFLQRKIRHSFLIAQIVRVQSQIRTALFLVHFTDWKVHLNEQEEFQQLFCIDHNHLTRLVVGIRSLIGVNANAQRRNERLSLRNHQQEQLQNNQFFQPTPNAKDQLSPATKLKRIEELTKTNTILNTGYKSCKLNFLNKYIAKAPPSPSLRLSERRLRLPTPSNSQWTQKIAHSICDSPGASSGKKNKKIKWDENVLVFAPDETLPIDKDGKCIQALELGKPSKPVLTNSIVQLPVGGVDFWDCFADKLTLEQQPPVVIDVQNLIVKSSSHLHPKRKRIKSAEKPSVNFDSMDIEAEVKAEYPVDSHRNKVVDECISACEILPLQLPTSALEGSSCSTVKPSRLRPPKCSNNTSISASGFPSSSAEVRATGVPSKITAK